MNRPASNAMRCLRLLSTAVAAASMLAAVQPIGRAAAESPAVRIYADFYLRVAYVETVGTLYNDTVERDSGSGLLIGDRLVVTNNHLVPAETNFRKLEIFVRLGSRDSAPIIVSSVRRDPTRDLAVLKLAQPVSLPTKPNCPIRMMDQSQSVPIGSSIFVLGYPVDQDISISPGIISNKTGPNGRWQTSAPLNPGNSGGPAFGESGMLVGFAVGGIVRWQHGDTVMAVQGVNFVIPTLSLLSGPLVQDLNALPASAKCWALASSTTPFDVTVFSSLTNATLTCAISAQGEATCSQKATPAPQSPLKFARSFTVTRIKDDHPNPLQKDYRMYQDKFAAEPGYRIKECRWQSSSENHLDSINCDIDPTGTSATLNYRLFSGPSFDRYRGWLYTTVTLREQRE